MVEGTGAYWAGADVDCERKAHPLLLLYFSSLFLIFSLLGRLKESITGSFLLSFVFLFMLLCTYSFREPLLLTKLKVIFYWGENRHPKKTPGRKSSFHVWEDTKHQVASYE